MNTKAKVTIAVLGSMVLALGIALGFVLWNGDQNDGAFSRHMSGGNPGMMVALGSGGSGQMMEMMAENRTPEECEAMFEQMAAFHDGQMPSEAMHQMMHSMMHQTPDHGHDVMPFPMMHQ